MDKIDGWFKRAFGKDASKTSSKASEGSSHGDSAKPNHKRSQTRNGKNQGQQHKKTNHKKTHNSGQHNSQKQKSQFQEQRPHKPTPILRNKVKIIPLGGLDEVGKNMMAVEYEEDIIIIDMGFEFPGDDLPGIDYVIPDVSYLEENRKRIRGVVLTHGHLDHIGGIPYILPKLDFPPVYGAKMTMGLVEHRIKEFKQEKLAKLFQIDPDKPLKLGKMVVKFIRVMHSIPDATAVVIETPAGKIMHTGDFKFDETPARNMRQGDIKKMEALGNDNILALFCESTNSRKPGHTISDKVVGEALEKAVSDAKGRVIVASFSSQIGRIQQILDAAAKTGRKVFVSGRSMLNNISIAHKLGYLSVVKGNIFDMKKYKAKENPDAKTLILTTGSQGEEFAALGRMARNDHNDISIKKGDSVLFSSSPIPGNERSIYSVINKLCIMGADVIDNKMMDIHTSGHAKQDELVRMINYVKPKYLVPIHGEYFMRQSLVKLAIERCNISEKNIIMIENGESVVGQNGQLLKGKDSIETQYILIDGSGRGHMGSQVITDRREMAKNGVLTILIHVKKGGGLKGNIDVVSRGFIYQHESQEVTQEISRIAREAYEKVRKKNPGANRKDIKYFIRRAVDKYAYKKLDRTPLIIPLIIDS